MKLEEVKKIAVIGAGNMGNQIAEILSRLGGYEVNIQDINDQFVSTAGTANRYNQRICYEVRLRLYNYSALLQGISREAVTINRLIGTSSALI